MTAFTVILFFVVIALGRAVNLSIEMMKHATVAMMKIPSILTSEHRAILTCSVPIVITIVDLIVFLFFAWSYTLTLSSNLTLTDYTHQIMGVVSDYLRPVSPFPSFLAENSTSMICEDPKTMTNCTLISKSISGSTSSDVVLAFWHLFMWFWTSGFVNAIGVMVVAGTIGKWYFKKEEEKGDVGSTTLLQALCCVLTSHLGSVAYGSLVIAVIQLVRSIMLWVMGARVTDRYIDRKFKETQTMNPLVKCGFKCCHCCLFCLEKCMRYISRNAYILVINRGQNFFKASVESFSLLVANLAKVTTLKSVSTLFIWIGKVGNCVLCVFLRVDDA